MLVNPDAQRIVGWKVAARAFAHHADKWLWGWGPETFPQVYRLHRTTADLQIVEFAAVADHAHNLPLELLVTLGVAGTAAFAWLLYTLWQEQDSVGRAAMLGLGMMSLVEPICAPAVCLLFFILGVHRMAPLVVLDAKDIKQYRFAAVACAIAFTGMWGSDFAAWQSTHEPPTSHSARVWAQLATVLNPAALNTLIARQRVNLSVVDYVAVYHPNDADANQLALMESLGNKDYDGAGKYLGRVIREDPSDPRYAAQAALLGLTAK